MIRFWGATIKNTGVPLRPLLIIYPFADSLEKKQCWKSIVFRCKGVYVSGKVCPKHMESSSPYAPPATSVLTQDLDITVLKEPASFYFRNTPDYVVDLNPLDTVILVKIRGWNFCNLTHG